MKKLKIIPASILVLILLIVTPLSIMAAGQTSTGSGTNIMPRVHLAIVQPWAVRVGQNLQLSVFERVNQTPVSGVSVWAVTKDKIDTVKTAVKALTAKGLDNITDADFEPILNVNGVPLGQTDGNGRLTHIFTGPSNYWLVALKGGYLPGYSHLAVTEILAISTPNKVAPGDSVTIKVSQKGTDVSVRGANLWAIDFPNAKILKDKLAAVRKANKGSLLNADWESILNNLAISLGSTDASGQVSHSFEKGRYLLITTLKGCAPAYSSIAIIVPQSSPAATPQNSP